MSTSNTGNLTHDGAVQVAESSRQAVVVKGATQATVVAAEIAFYRAARASAIANKCSPSTFIQALKDLGVGGA
jgi:hypothetical protein